MNVLIVGVAIAGPTLAYWLLRAGHRPTLLGTDVRYASLARSDLAATIYGALGGRAETILGDSVRAIEDGGATTRGCSCSPSSMMRWMCHRHVGSRRR